MNLKNETFKNILGVYYSVFLYIFSSHSITDDVTLQETAKATQFFLSDGIILTGKTTGDAVEVSDLKKTKSCCSLPILIGSGVTADNLGNYIEADAFIIGSYFKKDGL